MKRHRSPDSQKERHGTLGISAEACSVGVLPDAPLLLTTYMLFDASQGYLPLTVDVDLRDIVKGEDIDAKFRSCR